MIPAAPEHAPPQGTVLRFSLAQRLQHLLLLVSVTVLALTGLALRFHDTALGGALIELEGGIGTRGVLHRWAAVLLMATTAWHVLHVVFGRYAHEELMRLLPDREDVRSGLRSARSLFRAAPRPGEHGKYRLSQKLLYWLIAVAVVTLTLSGLALWFETAAMTVTSAATLAVMRVAHGFEGTLLVIVLVLWHLYEVHLRPGVFPWDGSFLHGRMTVERLRREHAREHRRLFGDEASASEKTP